MNLSFDCVLVYTLRTSGVRGRLMSGSIEWDGTDLNVYDDRGDLIDYLSGTRLRSWIVLRDGLALRDWSRVKPEDLNRLGIGYLKGY